MATEPLLSECQSTTHLRLPVADHTGRQYCFNCTIEEVQSQGYNLALRVMLDRQLAEDALQEAFLSAYRAFSGFRGGNLRGWLLRIVANSCKDMLRSRRARPSVSLDAMVLDPQDPESASVEFPSTEESPEEYALRRELGSAIQAGLQRLNDEQRMAVTLVDVQGLSYEEASQAMTCSLGTAKSRVSRGRAQMRDFFRDREELLPGQLRRNV